MRRKCARRRVLAGSLGKRIAREKRRDSGADRNGEGVARKCGGVDALALGGGGNGKDLGGAEDLAEALILAEVKGFVAAVVECLEGRQGRRW